MASNHVQLDDASQDGHSNNIYQQGHELHSYNQFFPSSNEQGFDATWDLNSSQLPVQARSHSQSVPHAWQSSSANQYFSPSFSNNQVPYQEAFSRRASAHQFDQPALDPALVSANTSSTNFDLGINQFNSPNQTPSTVVPQALQNDRQVLPNGSGAPKSVQNVSRPSISQQQTPPNAAGSLQSVVQSRLNFPAAPRGTASGDFTILDLDNLIKATNSKKIHNFINISDLSQDIPITKTTIPAYIPRHSRNQLRVLAAGDRKLLEKIAKRPKKTKSLTSKAKSKSVKLAKAPRPFSGAREEIVESASETESSDEESDYSSSDSDLEITEPSPVPTTRPADPLQGVRYDTLKAVWLPRRVVASAEQIRKALGEFWEIIRTVRDRWRADSNAVKQAEEAKKHSELPLLKDRVKTQRDMMESALKATLEHGHPEVLRLFGENQPFVFVLYQYMADRIREQDYNGSLSNAALDLLLQCTTLNNEVLEKTKVGKVLTIYSKRGNESTQSKTKKILDMVAAASNAKSNSSIIDKSSDGKENKDSKESKDKESKVKTELLKRAPPEPVAGVKRPRLGESVANQPVKRALSSSGSSPTASKIAPVISKRPSTVASEKPAIISKPAVKVVPKPVNMFAGLQSASKKSVVNKVAVVGAQKAAAAPEKKAPVALPTVSTSKPAFSFADTMANLLKPKEPEPAAKTEQTLPLETEEEREKRLRKEERRKLRVTWKPEESLQSIRYFTHDPDEEAGMDANMVREAGDVFAEGRAFKQLSKDKVDIDDEDDLPKEESYRDWKMPTEVDFSVVEQGERERNYNPYGGGLKHPSSPEKEAQDRHEANTLMVFYTHSSDIPPSPREPSDQPSSDPRLSTAFGTPSDLVQKRANRLGFKPYQSPPATGIQQSDSPDFSAVLGLLGANSSQSQSAPGSAREPTELEKIFAQFKSPAPATTAPESHTQANPQPPATTDLSALIANLTGQVQAQPTPVPQAQTQLPQYTLPTQSQQPEPQNQPQQQQQAALDLNAIIASLQQGQQAPFALPQQSSQQPQQQPQQQQPQPQQQQQQQQQQQLSYEEQQAQQQKRRREEELVAQQQQRAGYHKRQKWAGKGWNQSNPPQFILACRFWKEGKCKKGADCTYVHE